MSPADYEQVNQRWRPSNNMANGSGNPLTYRNGIHAGRSRATGTGNSQPPTISHPQAPMLFPQGRTRQIHPHTLQQRGFDNSINGPTQHPGYIPGMESYSLFPGSNSSQPGYQQLQHTAGDHTPKYTASFNHAPVFPNAPSTSSQGAYFDSGSFGRDLPAVSSYHHHNHPQAAVAQPQIDPNVQLPFYTSQTGTQGAIEGLNPSNIYGNPPTSSLPIAHNVLESQYGRGTYQTPESSPVGGQNYERISPRRFSVDRADRHDRSISGNTHSRNRGSQSQQSITPPQGDGQRPPQHLMGIPGPDLTSHSSADASSPNPPDILVCDVGGCGSRFTGEYRKGNLGRHKRNQHGGAEGKKKEYQCEESNCSNSYKRKDARLKHYRKEHPERLQPRRPTATPQSQ